MLYGIRRDLQQRLREEGYNVRVYVPFGDSWYPYLMRRMAERPANLLFVDRQRAARVAASRRLANPVAIGAGLLAGTLAALAWRSRGPAAERARHPLPAVDAEPHTHLLEVEVRDPGGGRIRWSW